MAESRKSVPSTTVDSQLITLQHEIHHIEARASAYVAHEQTYSVVREWSEVRGCIIRHSRHGEEGTLECIQHVVTTNVKQRYELQFDPDCFWIRAHQGHNMNVVRYT